MSVKGFLESVRSNQLRGWVYLTEDPSKYLEVVAEFEGQQIGRGTANLYREDLTKGGIGAGDHAFVMNLDQILAAEQLTAVKVFALQGNDSRTLLPTIGKTEVLKQHRPERYTGLPLAPTDDTQWPVFVLGAARSGTSAIAQALLSSGGYEGHEEGHLLPLLQRLLNAVHVFYADNADEARGMRDTFISRVPPTYFIGSVRGLFAHLPKKLYPTGRWIDKTPKAEMIAVAPILREIWPNARFIFMRRRAIENVASRMRKFPTFSFDEHCADWASVMKTWLYVRDKLGNAAIELDQVALARDPERFGQEMSRFLGLEGKTDILFKQAIKLDHPEQTSTAFASTYSLEKMDWTPEQKRKMIQSCGELMTSFAYGLDERYFL
jgi:hypothetical protein